MHVNRKRPKMGNAFDIFSLNFLLRVQKPRHDDLFEAWNAFAEHLQTSSNVTTVELRQKFGRELAAAYSLTITKQSVLQIKVIDVDFNTATYVDWHRNCYRMRFDLLPLQRGAQCCLGILLPYFTEFNEEFLIYFTLLLPSLKTFVLLYFTFTEYQ